MDQEESFRTVSAEDMLKLKFEILNYSPHDLKIISKKTKKETIDVTKSLIDNEANIFNFEKSIKETQFKLQQLKQKFIKEKQKRQDNQQKQVISIRKEIMIDNALNTNDQVPNKTKYVVEKCVPYLLEHGENFTFDSIKTMIFDDIIEKTHELHIDRLFEMYKPPPGFEKAVNWYETSVSSNYGHGSYVSIIFAYKKTAPSYYDYIRYYGIKGRKSQCLKYNSSFSVDFKLEQINGIS